VFELKDFPLYYDANNEFSSTKLFSVASSNFHSA